MTVPLTTRFLAEVSVLACPAKIPPLTPTSPPLLTPKTPNAKMPPPSALLPVVAMFRAPPLWIDDPVEAATD